MGLDKGLSPTYDLLVDKYFTTIDGPQGVFSRLRQNEVARHVEHVTFSIGKEKKCIENDISHRFDSLLKLEYEQRKNFVNKYGESSSHILSEHFRTFPVTFGFQKNSIFTSKFSEMIR